MANEKLKQPNESGDNEDQFVSRIFSLLTLTVSELRMLNIKTNESGGIIKQLSRYTSLFDEVAKLRISIDYNLLALKNKLEHFVEIHNKLHGFEEEIGSIMEELSIKVSDISIITTAQKYNSKIPMRIPKNSEKKDSKNQNIKTNIQNLEKKINALETVRKMCKELGYDGKLDENEFLITIFEEQKLKIKNILPVLELHIKFFTNLSKKLDDFQQFINELVAEMKTNTELVAKDQEHIRNLDIAVSSVENLQKIVKDKDMLQRQKTIILDRNASRTNVRPNTERPCSRKMINKPVDLNLTKIRPCTQNCRRNWIKVLPEPLVKSIRSSNFRPVLTPIKEERSENVASREQSQRQCSDGDKYCNSLNQNAEKKGRRDMAQQKETKNNNCVKVFRKKEELPKSRENELNGRNKSYCQVSSYQKPCSKTRAVLSA